MKGENQMRYKFYTNNKDIVIAVSSYAGKRVKGIAKLNPADTFDLEYGKRLAQYRCDIKVLKMRERAETIKFMEIKNSFDGLSKKLEKRRKALIDSRVKLNYEKIGLQTFLRQFEK